MSATLLLSAFIAGMVDSIGGGGGLISVPALIASGIPLPFLLGTNKGMAAIGSTAAVLRYRNAGLLPRLPRSLWFMFATASALFSMCGAWIAQTPFVVSRLQLLIPVLLALVLGFLAKRWFWDERRPGRAVLSSPAALSSVSSGLGVGLIGGYDGLFGPGAGTFFLSFLENRGLQTVQANAFTKILNLASNLGALLVFAVMHKVMWKTSLTAAAFFMAGNYLGAGLVLKNGKVLVRFGVVTVTTALLLKYAWVGIAG